MDLSKRTCCFAAAAPEARRLAPTSAMPRVFILPIVPTDPFAALFAHLTPSARIFFTGDLCQTAHFAGEGHLHLLKGGETLSAVPPNLTAEGAARA
jgi:hypothetical protein